MATRISRLVSFDAAMAATVTATCVWTVAQAYLDGTGPLEHQLLARRYSVDSERRLKFSPSLCRRLERVGYVVVDNFLTMDEVRSASKSIGNLESTNSFQVTANERDAVSSNLDEQVRTDRVCFVRGANNDDNANDNTMTSLYHIRHLLRSIGRELVESEFKGFTNEATGAADRFLSSDELYVPDMMQVSIYDGFHKDDEVVGAYYRSHVDACSDLIQSLGLLGYLKSKYLRKRYLTCIVYLNEDWTDLHGGCLRVFPVNGASHVDIEPRAGRLVIFSSVNTLHAVLPTFSKRLACSTWLTLVND